MLKFSSEPEMLVSIESEDSKELEYILKQFLIVYKDREYHWQTKSWRQVEKSVQYGEIDEQGKLILPRGLANLVYLKSNDNELDEKLSAMWGNGPFYKTIDKWTKIFENHPKADKGKVQINASRECETTSSGLISLQTGAGKGELIVAQAESIIEQTGKKVLIFVFSNAVKEELLLRAASYNVPISSKLGDLIDTTNNTKLFIMNPVGFMNSKEWKSKPVKDMLRYFDVVIADEAHHGSCASWRTMLKWISPTHVYGYTATADKDGGQRIESGLNPKECSLDLLEIISNFGLDIVRHELDIPIELYIRKIETITKDEYEARKVEFDTYPQQLGYDQSMHIGTAAFIRDSYRNIIKTGICFIPITLVESGKFLCEYLNKNGIPTVFWSGKLAITPAGEANSDFNLEALKEMAKAKAFKILITTTVGFEGIDIPGLDSVIPLSGSKYKTTLQPLGRAARSELIKCIILFDKNNWIYNTQSKTRLKIIRAQKNVTEVK